MIDYYIPINQKIESDVNLMYTFVDKLEKKKCAYVRIYESEPEVVKNKFTRFIRDFESKHMTMSESPYEVLILTYGEIIVDIYQPVVKDEGI